MIEWKKSAELNKMSINALKEYFNKYPQSHKKVVDVCKQCNASRLLEYRNTDSNVCSDCFIINFHKKYVGEDHPNYGKSPSLEARNKQSVAMKGRFRSDEYRKNISLAKLGEKNGMFGKKAPRSDKDRMHISAGHQKITYDEWTDFSDKNWREWDKAVYLNEPFFGCHRHHLTKTIVVCVPDELHNHINHVLKTGYNMGEMNMLALQFINGGL